MLPAFEKWTFNKHLYERMIDLQYGENGTRNIHSNYDYDESLCQMFSISIKIIMPYQPFHRAIDETLKSPEKC